MKRFPLLTTNLIFFLISFHSFSQSEDFKMLTHFMAGSFSSEEQHLSDTVNYYDIRLEIIPVWKERSDGSWFYVEQAMNGFLEKPYRQRVYRLIENEGKFESIVFNLKDPLRFTGKPELIEALTPDSLTEKEGCTVFLEKTGKQEFSGGTVGKNCPSDRRGATYATSVVNITENLLQSWDRGYNERDEQVWGAEKGGYLFVKLSQY
jgi:hypothetical protein